MKPAVHLCHNIVAILDADVRHEGVHVANDQAAAPTIYWAGWAKGWQSTNPAVDLTQYQNEFEAYKVTAAVLAGEGKTGQFAGERLGAGVGAAAALRHINTILANPSGIYRLTPASQGPRIFGLGVPR